MEIIKAVGLSKSYGNLQIKVQAVNNVDFSLNSGEFIVIVGASGSGKSTLLHLLGGLENPDSGEVYICGENIYKMKSDERTIFRRRNIGFIFQFFNLVPVLTARENIELPIDMNNEKINDDFLNELIEKLGLKEKENSFPNELSGGEQQRVAIARALITKPSVILADEPTGSLDRKNTLEVLNLLKLFSKKYGISVVMITHDLSIATIADRIIRIEDGGIVG